MVNYVEYYRFLDLHQKEEEVTVESIKREFRCSDEEAFRIASGTSEVAKSDFTVEQAITNLNNQKFKVQLEYVELRFVQFMGIESTMMHYKSMATLADRVLKYIVRPEDEEEFQESNTEVVGSHIIEMNAKYLVPIVTELLRRREMFHQREFVGVFFKKRDEDAEDSEEGQEVDESLSSLSKVDQKYYWYNIMDDLAKGDVLKHEAVLQLEMGFIAPKVAKDRTYDRIEYAQQKSEAAKMKSRSR